MINIKETANGTTFKIKVQPKASKNQISGIIGDALKLRLTAPPVDGAANDAVIEFFSKLFKVPKAKVEIVTGHTGRNKLIRIKGITADVVKQILNIQN